MLWLGVYRVCAGRYFADEALYLTIASILHVFNISAPLDEQGQPVKTELRQTSGLLTYVIGLEPHVCQRSRASR